MKAAICKIMVIELKGVLRIFKRYFIGFGEVFNE